MGLYRSSIGAGPERTHCVTRQTYTTGVNVRPECALRARGLLAAILLHTVTVACDFRSVPRLAAAPNLQLLAYIKPTLCLCTYCTNSVALRADGCLLDKVPNHCCGFHSHTLDGNALNRSIVQQHCSTSEKRHVPALCCPSSPQKIWNSYMQEAYT